MTEDNLNEQNNCDFSDISILVVEDDAISALLINKMFDNVGLKEIAFAENSDKALELFQTNKYNIVLMDYTLYGSSCNGIELTKKFKEISPSVPVIFQTARALLHEKEECLSSGAEDYISKPFKKNILLDTIVKYIPQPVQKV